MASGERRSDGRQAAFSMSENSQHLLARDPREPLQEVVHCTAVLKVLEQRTDGHPRSRKDPRATHSVGHALNGRALLPVQHSVSIGPFAGSDNHELQRLGAVRTRGEGEGQ